MSDSIAWPVHWHDRLASTNDEAKRQIEQGEVSSPSWIAARKQSKGRGQRGAHWIAPEGNLSATALFGLEASYPVHLLGLIAGLALVEALDAVASPGLARLKWPNDIRWQGRKLAGILVETCMHKSPDQEARRWAAIGFGVNIIAAPVMDQPTGYVQAMPGGRRVKAENLLVLLDRFLQFRLRQIQAGDASILGQDWIAHAETANLRLCVRNAPERSGVLSGLTEGGQLVLTSDSGQPICVSGGDVCRA